MTDRELLLGEVGHYVAQEKLFANLKIADDLFAKTTIRRRNL